MTSFRIAERLTENFPGAGKTVTWIAEILVHPERRRQGIGTRIMNELLRVTSLTAVYAEALAGTERFNESFGITKKSTLVTCSRKPLAG